MAGEQKIYLEDFTEGETTEFGRYEVTEKEILDFARKYDPQPFHIDKEAAKRSIFGGLCASGWHTCAMAMRMMVDHMAESGAASLGSPGVDNVRWTRPVFPGNVLRMRGKILEVRPSRTRPQMGLVKTEYSVLNEKDEPVMTFVGNGFFATRAGHLEAGEASPTH